MRMTMRMQAFSQWLFSGAPELALTVQESSMQETKLGFRSA